MDRKRAKLQLSLVRAVVRGARMRGSLSPELRQRAAEIVEHTAIDIRPEADGDLADLLAAVKAELAVD
ncbi:MAG TPA: hypothetical protein VFH90_05430 [Candidatus Limnocylindria bacterium]|nr:hypothetical protein [Candidatus Limnocylindria bacterium]